MQRGWQEFSAYLKTLSEEQMTARTDAVGWTVKDHLAHIAVWANGIDAMLGGDSRHEAMGIDLETWRHMMKTKDFDRINGLIQQRHKGKSLDEVFTMLHDAHQRLVEKVQAMSEEDLKLPYRHFQAESNSEVPIIDYIMAETYEHYAEHKPWIEAITAGG